MFRTCLLEPRRIPFAVRSPGGFMVLRSSAGAGKTHSLAKRWLLLALSSGDHLAYRRVLAITFTNKAARELKERVVDRLHALARGEEGDPGLADIRKTLREEGGLDDAGIRERSARVFRHVLHHWSDLSITTIDAFTRRVIKPFTRDLMLDGDLEMTTERKRYHRRAVDRMLMEVGNNAPLTELLRQVSFNLVDDEEKWRPDLKLLALTDELEKGATTAHLGELGELPLAEVLRLEVATRKVSEKFRDQVREMGRNALQLIHDHGIEDRDLAHARSGILSFLQKLEGFNVKRPSLNAHVRKVFEGGAWHSKSADAEAVRRIEAVKPALEKVYERFNAMEGAFREHAIRGAVIEGLLPTVALREIDARLEELKREDGVNFFNDLTRKAAGDLQHEPPEFIFERIGERFVHLMIDEFQDTSLLQWAALLPLVTNILGNGGSVQLVGDAKQAIYRWRDGEARLFSGFPALFGREGFHDGDRLEGALRTAFRPMGILNENRRSGSAIVNCNNTLFERMAALLPDPELKRIYEGLEQVPCATHAGRVELSTFSNSAANDASDDEEADDETVKTRENIRRAGEVVKRCIADGYRYTDIAILVRGGSAARAIAAHFEQDGLPVFSSDGLLLGSDPDVRLVIDLLHFIHTGAAEAAARAMGAMGPRLPPSAAMDPPGAIRAWLQEHRAIVARLPLPDLLVEVMAALGTSPVDNAYLMTLLDEAHAFAQAEASDIGWFLEHWNERASERSVRSGGSTDAVNLLTIHKSKGLEFPVVIVPDTTMGGRKDGDEHVWFHPDTVVPGLSSSMARLKKLKDLDLPEAEEAARLQLLDELNLLYVAFTRPVERLFAFVPQPKKFGAEERARSPFRAVLIDLITNEGSNGVYAAGGIEAPRKRGTGEAAFATLTSSGALQSPVKVALRREAPEEWDPSDPDPRRRHGTLVHAIMARVRTRDDLGSAMHAAIAAGDLSLEEGNALHEVIDRVITTPGIAPFFAPDAHAWMEMTLIDGNGHAHRPDRVVERSGGLGVLDIKTGGRSETHHAQVREYMRLLHEVERLPVTGHLLYLSTGTLEEVTAA